MSYLSSFCAYFLQIIFAKGGHYAISEISKLNYNVVGIDWTIDPSVARKLAEPGTVLQGNLDPVALFGNKVYHFIKYLNFDSHIGNVVGM